MANKHLEHDHSHLTPEQLAWAAGFIDGEGCITTVSNAHDRTIHMLTLTVANTNKDVIETLKLWFKCGSVNIARRRQTNPNWRDCYTWIVRAQAAEEVIKVIYPYLRVKTNQARLAFDLRDAVRRKQPNNVKADIAMNLRSFNTRRSVYSTQEVV